MSVDPQKDKCKVIKYTYYSASFVWETQCARVSHVLT